MQAAIAILLVQRRRGGPVFGFAGQVGHVEQRQQPVGFVRRFGETLERVVVVLAGQRELAAAKIDGPG
jgi:hypothetical protein